MADSDHIPPTKACKKCGDHKPLASEFFSPQAAGKYGFTSQCKACKNAAAEFMRARPDQKARQQAWRDSNKDYAKAYNKAYRDAGYKSTEDVARWRAANLEYSRERDRLKMQRYHAADPETFRRRGRESYQRNRVAAIARSANAYRTNKHVNLKMKIATRLRAMLRGKFPNRGASRLLGFTRHELVAHLERQFTKGMTWEKMLAGEIHIDHIIPVRAFKIESVGDDEFKACWALSNLRPLWAVDNLRKSGKILTLL